MEAVSVGSLFSGIGGLDLGLQRAGWRHVFFCESDEWRRGILAERFPGVPIYEDVREVAPRSKGGRGHLDRNEARADTQFNGPPLPIEPAVPHLLCGGFPCQDLSVAGRRAGLGGSHSGLFYEFSRIAESLRPGRLLIENVPGLLSSHGGRDFGVLLETLADIGYGVGWRILDSRFFGVPQRRRRVFIVGVLAGGDPAAAAQRAGEVLAVGQGCDRHSQTGEEAGQGTAVTFGNGAETGGRVVNAITSKLRKGTGGPAGDEVNHLVRADCPYCAPQGIDVRRLTPTECERLQALPDGWTDLGGTPDSRRYAALGDAVTVSVAEWLGRRLLA